MCKQECTCLCRQEGDGEMDAAPVSRARAARRLVDLLLCPRWGSQSFHVTKSYPSVCYFVSKQLPKHQSPTISLLVLASFQEGDLFVEVIYQRKTLSVPRLWDAGILWFLLFTQLKKTMGHFTVTSGRLLIDFGTDPNSNPINKIVDIPL